LAAVAGFQRSRIVADHVEYPEDESCAGHVSRHRRMETTHKRGDTADIGTHVFRAVGFRAEKLADHHAWLRELKRRGEACFMGRAGRHPLALAMNMVERV